MMLIIQILILFKKINHAMLCIAKYASCSPVSPGAVRLRKLLAAGEIPDTSVCSAPGHSFCKNAD